MGLTPPSYFGVFYIPDTLGATRCIVGLLALKKAGIYDTVVAAYDLP